ncbi:hypothetical protein KGF56_001244 [Candida oxycetoniae]|uniref:Uncharacterized protein n=1 Tax=Candida oxycetoniae TaxID=497107 RepID=A0AAI9WZL3_9ASCO|nr:uncharacterized protein KGF56_001244 [Candida oxycetoniae]KAI3406025.2 hypothetical protein KGF56_001244 [Candida oxycetoniae]
MILLILIIYLTYFAQSLGVENDPLVEVIKENELLASSLVQPASENIANFQTLKILEQLEKLPEFTQFGQDGHEKGEQQEGGQEKPQDTKDNKESSIPSHCQKKEIHIHSLQDLNAIIECETIIGDIIISEFDYPIITLAKLSKLEGNLTIYKSPELVRVESPQLSSIEGWFKLYELTSLALISFPSLKKVKILCWEILPILSNVQFNHEIHGIESITISDTSLTGFSGFLANELKVLDINNNRFLDSIECNVETISDYFHLSANAKEIKVNLPNLKKVNELSINNVEILQLDNLERIDNSMKLNDNFFHSIKFLKLKYIGGTLDLSKNSKLTSIDFPQLNEVQGGLMLIKNPLIEKVNCFPNLNIIGGALEIKGPITDISLKDLKLVKGSAIISSTSPAFDCEKWSKSEVLLVVRGGKIECTNSNNEKITSKTKENGGGGGGGAAAPAVGFTNNNNNNNNNGAKYLKKNTTASSMSTKQQSGSSGTSDATPTSLSLSSNDTGNMVLILLLHLLALSFVDVSL